MLFILLTTGCQQQQVTLPVTQLITRQPCNVAVAPCFVSGSDDLQIQVTFNQPVQALQPFDISLVMKATDAVQDITAAFSMNNMQMGINRYRFIQTTADHWQATVTLPVCISARSDWLMDVAMELEDRQLVFTVPFEMRNLKGHLLIRIFV